MGGGIVSGEHSLGLDREQCTLKRVQECTWMGEPFAWLGEEVHLRKCESVLERVYEHTQMSEPFDTTVC